MTKEEIIAGLRNYELITGRSWIGNGNFEKHVVEYLDWLDVKKPDIYRKLIANLTEDGFTRPEIEKTDDIYKVLSYYTYDNFDNYAEFLISKGHQENLEQFITKVREEIQYSDLLRVIEDREKELNRLKLWLM